MKTKLLAGLMAAATMSAVALPSAAVAQDYGDRGGQDNGGRGYGDHGDRGRGYGDQGYGNRDGYRGGPGGGRGDNRWNGDRNGGWDPSQHYQNGRGGYQERRMGRNDRIYRGRDGRYYCRRNDGTTGLVIGAIGGGLLGGAIGGNTLGALLGAGGGALLGRSVDRGQVRCR
ncbi:MAG: hypothetical protein ACRYFW_15820 [Janthinobacterium lividum]